MKTIRTVYLQDVVSIIDNDDITSIIVHGKVYDKVKFGGVDRQTDNRWI